MKRTDYFTIMAATAAIVIATLALSAAFCSSIINLAIALAFARFAIALKVFDWKYGVKFVVSIWTGFQAMLLANNILQESVWWTLNAIHAGAFARLMLRA
jgi:predicted membrane channel-forming protein YqfA (hemolysin III family)